MKGINSWKKLVKPALVIAAIAAWVSIPFFNQSAEAGGVPILVRTANLVSPTGSINPHGDSEYQVYANGHREIEVEIEDVALPAGTVLNAVVDGNSIGSIILAADQRGRLKLRTEDGQNVPVTVDGSSVQVLGNNNVLVSGILGGGGPNPTPSASPSPSASPTGSPNPSPTSSPNPSPSPSPTGSPNSGNLFAGLSGAVIGGVVPLGYAEFEVHSSRLELEIRVRQINLPAGTTVTAIVDSITVGNFQIESDLEGRLRLRTDRGETVPPVVGGSTIVLTVNGSTILNGVFAGFTGPSPSPSPSPGETPGPTPSPSPSFGRSFEAHLTGTGTTPPVQTSANGEIKVSLNESETQATIFGEFHNLTSAQTAAYIETTTSNATTVYQFPVLGGTNGNFASITIDVSSALVQQLRTGLWSAVISSQNNPGGEIRGTLIPRSSLSDLDGNGTNDFAVFRPSTGQWFAQNGAGITFDQLGGAGDKVVSGDYDGDGRTDIAVFRNVGGAGIWEIKRSSDGGITGLQFGYATDKPVRGDFDGDGRSDIAVYRAETGVWYVQRSQDGGFSIDRFGLAEDIPMPADVDGDGRDDLMVYRPSTGIWYWRKSSDGSFGGARFGLSDDIPVSGDFDGDGRADLAVFRPSNGVWYIARSSDGGYTILQFGLLGDVPVAGQYDEDLKTDIAVFRPSDGKWYILRSLDGAVQVIRFGTNGDVPLVSR